MDTILRSRFWSEGIRSRVKGLFDSLSHTLPQSIPWPLDSLVEENRVRLPCGAILEFGTAMPMAPVRWSPILHKDGTVEATATYCVYHRSTGNVPLADLREIGHLAEIPTPFLSLDEESDTGNHRYDRDGVKWGTPREVARFQKTYFAN